MCEEILPNLFRNKIPLPDSPLKYLNSYIIRDSERSLIVDTGLNRKTCLDAMQRGLNTLGIDLSKMDISPNIVCWSDGENPLARFLASLDKVQKLPVDLVLPGHRRLIDSPKDRIAELKKHHAARLDEVLALLNGSSMSAFQIASNMTWDIVSENWDQFPATQKWFATGEAISHLRYLEEAGRIMRKTEKKITKFEISK